MKNSIKLLLILSLTPFIINCTGSLSQMNLPSTQTNSPIGSPVLRPETTPQSGDSSTSTRNHTAYGESFISPKFKLPSKLKESSALIKLDNKLWTLNDGGGKAELYQIDEKSGKIVKTLKITNARNKDWEDLAYDDSHVYIGDFGNNRGKRKDLKVYKIPRSALTSKKRVKAKVIKFKYSDQKSFKSAVRKTNYDCEAMVAHNGKLYLFSKDWGDNRSRLYELSTKAGKHTAKYISSFNTQSMVTGATINKKSNMLLLSTYSSLLNVNVWAFSNFSGNNLFNGSAKKLHLKMPLQGQIEGITFTDKYKAYLSSEAFKKYIFSFDAMLYGLDFSGEFQ